MTDTWCIENDFAAQRELAVIEEARSSREIEKLRAQLAASEQRVNALKEISEMKIPYCDAYDVAHSMRFIARDALNDNCRGES